MSDTKKNIIGEHCVIGERVILGSNVYIGHNCILEGDIEIGDNAYIDSNTIIRKGVKIDANAFIGSNCVLGEYGMDFCVDHKYHHSPLIIGNDALIRSGSIIYAGSSIGNHFQTGHHVTIREKSDIGHHVSIGTLSDIQGNCRIGSFVRLHSNVHIGQLSVIDSYTWIFPYVVLTNDPTPPSEHFEGVHIRSFSIIATGAIIMPGLDIGQDSLVGAGAIVTKDVDPYAVVLGNPAKKVSDVRNIKSKITGEVVYPWRYHYNRYMPWEHEGFEAWYNSLDLDSKKENMVYDIVE